MQTGKEVKKMKKLNNFDWLAIILVIIGGLNWGLFGIFRLDLVDAILNKISWLQNIVYVLVGLAAVYLIIIVSKLGRKEE